MEKIFLIFDDFFDISEISEYRVPCLIKLDNNFFLDFHGSMIYSDFEEEGNTDVSEEIKKITGRKVKVFTRSKDIQDFSNQLEIFEEFGVKRLSKDEAISLFNILNLIAVKGKELKGNFITVNPGFSDDMSFFVLVDSNFFFKVQDMLKRTWGKHVLSRVFGVIVKSIASKYSYKAKNTTLFEIMLNPSKDFEVLKKFFDDIEKVDELSQGFLKENFEKWCESIPKIDKWDLSKITDALVMSDEPEKTLTEIWRILNDLIRAFLRIDEDVIDFLKKNMIL